MQKHRKLKCENKYVIRGATNGACALNGIPDENKQSERILPNKITISRKLLTQATICAFGILIYCIFW